MRTHVVILWCLGWMGHALNAEAASYPLRLQDLPARVKSSQPELKAARWKIEEAKGRLLGAGRWSNPELGLESKRSRDFKEWSVGLSLDQKFPLTSRLSLEKELSSQAVAIAELEIVEMERQLVAQAQTAAIKWLAMEAFVSMRKAQTELARKLQAFASEGAERGEISTLDATQMRLEAQQFELESRKISLELIALKGELKQLLGLKSNDTLKLQGGLPEVKLPSSTRQKNRPDREASKLREVSGHKEIDLAKRKKWEDLNVGVFVEGERAEDAPEGFENEAFVGFRLSIAWPWWNKNEGEVAEKVAQAQRLQAETVALEAAIDQEAAMALEEMRAHADLAQTTERELLPLVKQQTEALEAAYETGQSDLLSVLRAREQHLQLQATVLEAKRDFHLARVKYEAAMGNHVRVKPAAK